jgi:hypothetical protein
MSTKRSKAIPRIVSPGEWQAAREKLLVKEKAMTRSLRACRGAPPVADGTGVMNLWWLSALTVFVVLEKLTSCWSQGTRLSGVLLLAAGVWILRYDLIDEIGWLI